MTSSTSTPSTHSDASRVRALRPVPRPSSSTKIPSPHNGPNTPHRFSAELNRSSSITSSKASSRRETALFRESSLSSPKLSRHHHSPSAPSPSRRPNSGWEASIAASPIDETVEEKSPGHIRTESRGTVLDEKIREAEEKIRASRRPRTAGENDLTSPTTGIIRRHDSYTRAAGTTMERAWSGGAGNTLRRSATTSGMVTRTPDGGEDQGEQEKSGGSGGSKNRKPLPSQFRSGPLVSVGRFTAVSGVFSGNLFLQFTPSPKHSPYDMRKSMDGPSLSPTNPFSRFSTTSRLSRDSPMGGASPASYRGSMDGLERRVSLSTRTNRRQWSESISGLPTRPYDVDNQGPPFPRDAPERRRAESVLDTTNARDRYSTIRDVQPRLPRLNLTPGDSVSAVGARSERSTPVPNGKDPLQVLKRIEESRTQHNRQWDVERSASVLGERPPSSQWSPQRARPATSMSSLRDNAPRTAPVEQYRRPHEEFTSPARASSRLSQPSTEPRPVRSSTSLGGRSSASLEVHIASTEHGRLLFEAARALELKLAPEVLANMPELARTFIATARSAENINSILRTAMELVTQMEVDMDANHLVHSMSGLMRDAGRASDQSVRDLTRIMLDIPKLLREGSRSNGVNGTTRLDHRASLNTPRKWNSPNYDTPVRRSEELVRPSSSLGDFASSPLGNRHRPRDSLPANFGADRVSFLSRVKNLAPSPRTRLTEESLGTIEASPPTPMTDKVPALESVTSPGRRLRKKLSSTSTNTLRGNTFLPSAKVRTTTAISAVTAGDISPTLPASVRSKRDSRGGQDFDGEGSPASRFSFDAASGGVGGGGGDDGGGGGLVGSVEEEEDAVSILEQNLVAAQRKREEGLGFDGVAGTDGRLVVGVGRSASGSTRRWNNVSDRFRATLGRSAR